MFHPRAGIVTGAFFLLAACGLAGCGDSQPPAVVDAPVAPVKPMVIKAESLPDVKFVDHRARRQAPYRNDVGTFVEVTEQAKAKGSDDWLTSAAFFDMENDGDGLVDLAVANDAVPNFFFHNVGDGVKFEEMGITAGVPFDPSGAAGGRWGSTGPTSKSTSRSAWPSATSPTR